MSNQLKVELKSSEFRWEGNTGYLLKLDYSDAVRSTCYVVSDRTGEKVEFRFVYFTEDGQDEHYKSKCGKFEFYTPKR